MAKPDWGALQHQFLAEHAKSGISPKDWCEAQGLNYATARRYIKKPTAQSAQKNAQKKMRTAQAKKSAEKLLNSELTPQQKRFVAEYLIDQNATAEAERLEQEVELKRKGKGKDDEPTVVIKLVNSPDGD